MTNFVRVKTARSLTCAVRQTLSGYQPRHRSARTIQLKDSKPFQFVPKSYWQTRFKYLDILDWAVIVMVVVGIFVAFYTLSLRHP